MKVIGVKFKEGGKLYYFAPKDSEKYEEEMQVIVETSKGMEMAFVVQLPQDVDEKDVVQPLRPIVRIATDRDREQVRRNRERKPQALKTAQEKIEKHNLAMKLIDCEFSFEGNKVIFYFAAEGRVDFRELVKDLASTFHMRIDCGRWARATKRGFWAASRPAAGNAAAPAPCRISKKVSIKMAKVQGLSLNPGKISGLCGRLMCCLSYENEYYSDVYKKMPKVGAEVSTPEGKGSVVSENMLKLTVRVKIEKGGNLVYKDFPLADIRFTKGGKGGKPEKEEKDEPIDPSLKELLD